jgi:hypothetical protein
MRQHERLLLVVRDVDERGARALLERAQLDLHALAELQVERSERLVESSTGGLVDERPHQRDALVHAAGELRRPAVGDALEPDQLEGARDPLAHLALRRTRGAQAVGHVVEDVQMREQRVALEDHVQRPPFGRQPHEVGAVEGDPPLGRRLEPRDHAEQRRLAAPARPEQRHELAATDVEVDAVDGQVAWEPLGDAPQRQERLAHRGPSAGSARTSATSAPRAAPHRGRAAPRRAPGSGRRPASRRRPAAAPPPRPAPARRRTPRPPRCRRPGSRRTGRPRGGEASAGSGRSSSTPGRRGRPGRRARALP